MALGSTNVPISSGWLTCITAGAVATQDASTITNTSSIDGTKKLRIVLPDGAEHFQIRLCYDTATTAITTNLGIKVFGRRLYDPYTPTGTGDGWQIIQNRNQVSSVTVTAAPTTDLDTTIGSTSYSTTTVDEFAHVFNAKGCNEIVIGVETAFSPTDGVATGAILQIKLVEVE